MYFPRMMPGNATLLFCMVSASLMLLIKCQRHGAGAGKQYPGWSPEEGAAAARAARVDAISRSCGPPLLACGPCSVLDLPSACTAGTSLILRPQQGDTF